MDFLDRSVNNIRAGFDDLTPKKIIRIIIIVGAYALLRPYLMKLTGNAQMRQHEKAEQEGTDAQISPNELRGQVDIPEDSDDEDVGQTSASDWGKKARKRQRDVLNKMIEAEEKRLAELQEDEEDKDIEEFLVKE